MGETGDKPMAKGKSSMQKFWGRIHWDDERLAQLRRVTNQTHPHPYNKDVRGEQVVGVQPSPLCGESRPDQGTRSPEKEQIGHRRLEGETRGPFAGGDLALDIRSLRRRLSMMLRAHRMVRNMSI